MKYFFTAILLLIGTLLRNSSVRADITVTNHATSDHRKPRGQVLI